MKKIFLSPEEIRARYSTSSNFNPTFNQYFYSEEDVISMMNMYHNQFLKKGLDYEKLKTKMDDFISNLSKEELENWLAMDKARMKCEKWRGHTNKKE